MGIKTPQTNSSWSAPAIFPGTTQVVASSTPSAQSAALGSSLVRVAVTQDTWIKFGANPTADKTASIFMAAGSVEYFGCVSTDKLAVLRDSADGSVSITPAIEVS